MSLSPKPCPSISRISGIQTRNLTLLSWHAIPSVPLSQKGSSYSVTYPEILWNTACIQNHLFQCHVIPFFHGGTEGPKSYEFTTSTLLEKALKALSSHFKFEQTFVFLLFLYFLCARVWVPICYLYPSLFPRRYAIYFILL